jgi:hypothetical protein
MDRCGNVAERKGDGTITCESEHAPVVRPFDETTTDYVSNSDVGVFGALSDEGVAC